MKTNLYKFIFSVIFSFCLFALHSHAQKVRVFNTENSGLPHNQVTSMAIDAQGNKWFGTLHGEVVKFDNVNWIVYNSSNSGLPGLYRIGSIVIDDQDNKWVGTSFTPNLESGAGLVKFDNSKWTVYNRSNSGLPNNTVTGIALDSFGNKWVGTWGGGVAKFDDINWTVYLSLKSIHAIETDAQGNKWVGTESGLAKFDDTSWNVYNYSKSIIPYYNGNGGITSIAIDKEGNKWFGIPEDWDSGANGGVTKFDNVNWTVYNSDNSDLTFSVHCIAVDMMGNKWFGTSYWEDGALVKFDGSNWTVYDSANSGFPNDWIESLVIDDQGNKWFATGNSGVVLFNENGITTALSDKIPETSNDFLVYPNPAKDFITIEGLQDGAVEIFNSAGAILIKSEVLRTPAKINISRLPEGIYTLKVITKDKVVTKKVIREN